MSMPMPMSDDLRWMVRSNAMAWHADGMCHLPFVICQGVRIGMVVNDMADVNVDAKLVRDDPNAQGTGADSVELQNGCICW